MSIGRIDEVDEVKEERCKVIPCPFSLSDRALILSIAAPRLYVYIAVSFFGGHT